MGLFSCFSGGDESPRPGQVHDQHRKAPRAQEVKPTKPRSDIIGLSFAPPAGARSPGPAVQQAPYSHDSEDASSKDVAPARALDQTREPAMSPRLFVNLPVTSIAPVLLPFTDESSEAALQPYLASLGKHSAGLPEAVNENPDAGRIFGAAFRLHKAASGVLVNGENATMLAVLGQDAVRSLDVAGRKGALSAVDLTALLKPLYDSLPLVEVYGREGWLLHMSCNDHIKADFDHQHNAIVEVLEAAGLEVPGKPFPLPRGIYLDVNRNLRRCLKRMGGGSVAQGLKAAKSKQSLDDALELASHLGVGAEAVSRELAALPADVPLDVYYSRMVARGTKVVPLEMEQCKAIFDMYDKDRLGYLDRATLRLVLADLGALEGLKAPEVDAAVGRAFSLADRDNDGRITVDEFASYYETLTCSDARKQLRLALGPAAEVELKQFFNDFCSFGTRQAVEEMDNAHFAKFCKDCNLLGKDLAVTDIDLAFTRAKPKGCRKLSFEGFVTALAECAERKGVTLEALVRTVLACQGPVARATKAENVRLHDDKSTYTGVYAKGGPKVTDAGHDLAALLDRSDVKRSQRTQRATNVAVLDSKAADKAQQHLQTGGHSVTLTNSLLPTSSATKRRSTVGGTSGHLARGSLHDIWAVWCQSSGAASRTEMGVTQFVKMLRETGLLDRAFTPVQAELIFVRAKSKDSAKLGFDAFERALRMIAEAKGVVQEEVERAVLKSQGPMLTARNS